MNNEPTAAEQIRQALDSSPYGDLLRNPARRHQLTFEAMATSTDPMTREVGHQLLTGSATPRELLQHQDYRDFFQHTLTAAQQLDIEKLREDTDAVLSTRQLSGDLTQDMPTTEQAGTDTSEGDAGRQR
jgi:uncharacterized membrane-anchored protein YhcB (DUF1043 family)